MRSVPASDLGLDTATSTLTGNRGINQDRCLAINSQGTVLLALADGMGGHPMGEVAAQILVDVCEREIYKVPRPVPSPAEFLAGLLSIAHKEIQQFGTEQRPPAEPRTTAVIALVQSGRVHWVYIGDSRLYLFRRGDLLHRTTDHSYVARLLQQGLISESQVDTHPQRNYVTRCLGGGGKLQKYDQGLRDLEVDDMLLLCSDGLWQSVGDEVMREVLFNERDMAQAATLLTEEAARVAFPSSDNVTAVVARVTRERKVAPAVKPDTRAGSGHNSLKSDDISDAVKALEKAIGELEDPDTGNG